MAVGRTEGGIRSRGAKDSLPGLGVPEGSLCWPALRSAHLEGSRGLPRMPRTGDAELGFEGCLGVPPVGKQGDGPCRINGQSVCSGVGCRWASAGWAPPPSVLPPECCNYGSVTTLDRALLADRTPLNLSLSPAPSAAPGKTRDAWYMPAESMNRIQTGRGAVV